MPLTVVTSKYLGKSQVASDHLPLLSRLIHVTEIRLSTSHQYNH